MRADSASWIGLKGHGAYYVSSNRKKLAHPVRAVQFLLAQQTFQTHAFRKKSIEERRKALERVGIGANRHGQRDTWTIVCAQIRE